MKNIWHYIRKKDTRNLEIVFLDLYGKEKVLTMPKKRLKLIKKSGLSCDGSNISNFKEANNSDLKLMPDCTSFYPLPNKNLMMFCNVDFKYDARKRLKKLEELLIKEKYFVNIGAELEFFLFDKNQSKKGDNLHYCEYENNKQFACLNKILEFCESTNIEIEAFHHECGSSQFEIDFKYSSPVKTADSIVFLKRIIKNFANEYNLETCFLPKPIFNTSGSGMHVNISVYDSKKNNLFYEKSKKNHLSNFALSFIDGILNHIGAITAIANPIPNSYDRLNSGFESPSKVVIGTNNRNALIRIPETNKSAKRIELRSPDISCNPYLTFLIILMSGFEFLFCSKKQIKKNKRIKHLPKTLNDASKLLKLDSYLFNILPGSYLKNNDLI